ncbi:MAG TPA: FAD-dependent oxidoreductase [Solirubrobacteraceae bacterium]|nr:FAD-dependent oxidoreductase [Solirubrobacteraceae bacterium]
MADVIVVGAGVLGLAAAYELRRAGHTVRVVSADVPGSRQSAGLSRIFRLAHADGPLTEAAARSLGLWEEWEAAAGAPLLDRTGLLLTGDMSDREPHLRPFGGLRQLSGRAHPLAVDQEWWLLELTGATTRAEETVRFLQARADVTLDEVVRVDRHGVQLSGGDRWDADAVVVCAGPDSYRWLGLPRPERLRSVRFSFPLRQPLESGAPCWIHRDEQLCEPFYAVMDGPDHYSVGLSGSASADVPEAEHIRDAHRRATAIVRRVFPGLLPIAERVIACEYCVNPSGPAHDGWDMRCRDGVVGVTGPSLFKFAPLVGRLVAQRVTAAVAGIGPTGG